MSVTRLATLLPFLAIAGAAGAAPAAFDSAWCELTASFDADMEANGYVGGSLYFLKDGKTVGRHHYGLQSQDPDKPVDENTIYHWASITKTLTAIGIMQLRDRGLLRLDDPVLAYVPALRQIHNPYGDVSDVTLRHLITHTSGLRGPTFPWGGDEAWHPHEPTDWSQFDAMLPYTRLHFAPGSEYRYSNPGTSLMGRVIQIITGDDIEVYLEKNLLKPLGMRRSDFDGTPWHLRRYRSDNYFVVNGDAISNGIDFDTGMTTGNGGLNGPVSDMVRYLNFLLAINDGGFGAEVLQRDSLQAMWRPLAVHEAFPALSEQMGMSFFVLDHKLDDVAEPTRYVGHTGGQLGFQSFVYIHPASGTAAIMAVNSRSNPAERTLYNETRMRLFETVFPLFFDTR